MPKRKLIHDYNTIYRRHLGGETISNISKETGIPLMSIYSHFQRNKWKYNKDIQIRQSRYLVNNNYLDNINSEDKAYFLGWILSDGNVSKNRFKIKLKKDDEYIIKEMFGKFSIGYKSTTDKSGKSMSLSSTNLIKALKKLGCVENKTNMGFDLPDLPEKLFRHFVRGYFDGDGSIGIRSARPNQMQISICSIDENFLIQLQNKLIEHKIFSLVYKEKRKGKLIKIPDGKKCIANKDMYRLILPSHKEKLKFYEFLYNDCTIKLLRKYEKYTNYYNNTILTLQKKNSNIVKKVNDKYLINYDLINRNTFMFGDEVDEELVLNLYKQGKCEYGIHKETKIGRRIIKKILSNL